jgi:hypothetical protein
MNHVARQPVYIRLPERPGKATEWAAMNLAEWLRRELESSPKFADRTARRRAELAVERRSPTSHTLADFPSLTALRRELEAARLQPRQTRQYRWSDDRVEEADKDPAPNEPLDAHRRYANGAQTDAHLFIGATAPADDLHAYYCGSGALPIPSEYASRPALSGAQASSAAAHLSGADHKTPGACAKAWHTALGGVEGRSIPCTDVEIRVATPFRFDRFDG